MQAQAYEGYFESGKFYTVNEPIAMLFSRLIFSSPLIAYQLIVVKGLVKEIVLKVIAVL
ncbi:MAG: hypothetical protein FWF78_00860 [Defluviitaleaceae bacterium]|nr:hypothetical protein [Defluviitaleaceae bacterium]